MTELAGAPAETQQVIWLHQVVAGMRGGEGEFTVHALPAHLSQRARRIRVRKIMVEAGALPGRITHGADRYGSIDVSVGDARGGPRLLAYAMPAGTAECRIELGSAFPGHGVFTVRLKNFVDTHGSRLMGEVQTDVYDPVPEPSLDYEVATWEHADMRRWLHWAGLEPVDPGPIRIGTPFTVRTQVASLQAR